MDERSEIGEPASLEPLKSELDRSTRLSSLTVQRIVAWLLVPLALGLLVLFLNRLFRVASCETFDEFTYLRLGIRIFRYHEMASMSSPMTPPLPILLQYWLPALQARFLPEGEGWEMEVPGLIRSARLLASIFIGVPLVLLVYAWLARRRGWLVGALGGGLVALSPTVLAASSIATTDACFALFALVALMALRRYQLRPGRGSYFLLGAAIGVALASKQSGAILFPVALVEFFLKLSGRKPGWTWVDYGLWVVFRAGSWISGLVALAFLVDWAFYGFGLGPTFGAGNANISLPIIVPMIADLFPNSEAVVDSARHLRPPLAIDTFIGQMNHAARGHAAFLMGRHAFRGWWYFFPVAIGVKSTPAELLMIGLTLFLAFRKRNWTDPTRRLWLSTAGFMLLAGVCSSLNIGHRYMLLIYPLIVLISLDWLGEHAGRFSRRVMASGVLLLAWQGLCVAGIAPHYLAYFNSFCGGPSQGYRYLVDSSLDWGQDLPSLRRELEARGYRRVGLTYFGTANPSAYGLRSVGWTSLDKSAISECDWLAISATSLQRVYGSNGSNTEVFEALPSIKVGYSIFLYDLKDSRVRKAWDGIHPFLRVPWKAENSHPGQ
jgi:4-amino-4-deoxy-L-arabinose transferase-like glycosyltransferase